MVVVNTKWIKTKEQILTTAKWIKRGTKVIVVAGSEPKETTVEGQFGKRSVYMIETRNYGLIYVNPLQLIEIVQALEMAEFQNVTVEL